MIYLLDPLGHWDDTYSEFYIELSGDKGNVDKEILKRSVEHYLETCFGYVNDLIIDFEVDFDNLKIKFKLQPSWSESPLDIEENTYSLRAIPKLET